MNPKVNNIAFSTSLVSEKEMDELLATEDEFRRACKRRDRRRGSGWHGSPPADDLTAFMRSYGKISPLTHGEVIDLCRRYHAGVVARSMLRGDGNLDEDSVRRYEKLGEMGDLAREHLIISNIPLVFALAPRRSRGDLDYTDFMQAGISGLMRAVEFFDFTRGFKFSTYAAYCIKSEFEAARSREGRLICLTHNTYDEMCAVMKAEFEIEGRTGTSPTDKEIAEQAGLPERRVQVLRRVSKNPISLDVPANDDDETISLVDTIADEDTPSNALMLDEEKFLSAALSSLVADLSDIEQFVVKHYYGLGGCERMTLNDLRVVLGITRQAVSLRLKTALRKMRRNPKADGLEDFLYDSL